jgi:nanoRNase/pAp phosphatase (c-di-AMP/oligoRNAs hydrolase)
LEPRNPSKISDIGTVLAYLSAEEGLLNLAVLAMKNYTENRMSCRSHRLKGQPMALELAKMFDGGGHTEAAGFKISTNDFRGRFKLLSGATVSTNFHISFEDV